MTGGERIAQAVVYGVAVAGFVLFSAFWGSILGECPADGSCHAGPEVFRGMARLATIPVSAVVLVSAFIARPVRVWHRAGWALAAAAGFALAYRKEDPLAALLAVALAIIVLNLPRRKTWKWG